MGYSSGALWDCGNTHSCFWERWGGYGLVNHICIYIWPCVSWWCHVRNSLSTWLALHEGNPSVTVGFPSRKTSIMKLWCFLCCYPLRSISQAVELSSISCAMLLMGTWHSQRFQALPSTLYINVQWIVFVWNIYACKSEVIITACYMGHQLSVTLIRQFSAWHQKLISAKVTS